MKTLDEVIDELEDEGLFADALHYLKEYRRDCEELVEAAKSLTKKEHELAVTEKNDPLTWDELQHMEGKPVWVEYEYDGKGEWTIVRIVEENNMIDDIGAYPREQLGKAWQAYRKERTE